MKVLIDTGQGYVDYTQYVVDGSLSVEDSINVPTLLNFSLAATDDSFVLPKRSSFVRVISDIYTAIPGTGILTSSLVIPGIYGTGDAVQTFSPVQGFLGNTGVAVDPQGNIYASLTSDHVYFGALVKLAPDGRQLALQGDSGSCIGGVSVNPRHCWNCQGKYPPCFGYGGDVAYIPYGSGYIAYAEAGPGGFGNSVNVCRASDLGILNGAGGYFNYGVVGSLNQPAVAGDASGNVYCLNSDGSATVLTVAAMPAGASPTCTQCVGPGETQVYEYNSVSNHTLTAQLGSTGTPCIGTTPDGMVLLALTGSSNIIKWNPSTSSVAGTLSAAGMSLDRIAFKHIGTDGVMAVRGTSDNFILIDTLTMTVLATLSNVHTLVTAPGNNFIGTSDAGRTAYDQPANTIVFYDSTKNITFSIFLGSVNTASTLTGTTTIADVTVNDTLLPDTLTLANGSAHAVSQTTAQIAVLPFASGPMVLASGFITNEPERVYLGLNQSLPSKGFQQLEYRVSVTSDEWLLNSRTVPYIPAFIGKTQGEILSAIANVLAPNFFDVTTNVASGDIIPYFQYDPSQTWSDLAKQWGDASRMRYKVLDRIFYYLPFNDQPLGLSYDESQNQATFFPVQLSTGVVSVPPVNDALVLGNTEPQTNWENYFVGDGFTSQFRLLHDVFEGSTALLLQDDWTGGSFQTNLWNVVDPANTMQVAGALNVITPNAASGGLGGTYVLSNQGVELGGSLNFTHGEFEFEDYSVGIVGGIYTSTTLSQANCIAGFNVTTGPNLIVTGASGAAGVIIQPILNGNTIGPQITTQQNHHYVLQTYVGAETWSRYEQVYRNLNLSATYGGNYLTASGTITFVIADYDQGLFAITPPYLQQTIQPVITKYTVNAINLPQFAAYALINNIQLNCTINYTSIANPPQGSLFVKSLTGATGLQLPILPQNIGPEIHYAMGFGLVGQTATVLSQQDTQYLAFYNDTIPAVGSRIRFQSWAAGQAAGRVVDPIAVTNEAVVSGDSGVRSAIFTDLTPKPRTSAECELAAAAAIHDRENPQFQGTYTIQQIPTVFEDLLELKNLNDYPRSGRAFYVNSPVRAITGQYMATNTVRIQVLETRQEVLQVSVDYGPDLYLEKILNSFLQRSDNLLEPTETAPATNFIYLDQVGNSSLSGMDSAQIINIQNSAATGNTITIDLGVFPITACEIRRNDANWGTDDPNRLAYVVGQRYVTLPRSQRDQTWYLRQINGPYKSRYSKALRVGYPFVPSPPLLTALAGSDLTFGYNGVVSDIYGIELRAPAVSGTYILNFPPAGGSNTNPSFNAYRAARNQSFVNVNTFNTYMAVNANPGIVVGDVIQTACNADSSFSGLQLVTNVAADNALDTGRVYLHGAVSGFFWDSIHSTNGEFDQDATYGKLNPPLGGTHPAQGYKVGTSLMFNPPQLTGSIDPNVNPIQWANIDSMGNIVPGPGTQPNGYFALSALPPTSYNVYEFVDCVVLCQLYFPAPGSYTLYITHDDGMIFAIQGATLVSGTRADPGNHTSTGSQSYSFVNGGVAGNNNSAHGGPYQETFVVSVPAAGIYNAEFDWQNWEHEATMCVYSKSTNLPIISDQGSAIGTALGWWDYGQSFPISLGIANPGFNIGSVQLYQHGNSWQLATGLVSGGIVTLQTTTTHSIAGGDIIIVGAGWNSYPGKTTGQVSPGGDASFFTGVFQVLNVPATNKVQFAALSPVPSADFAVQNLSGYVAKLPNSNGGTTVTVNGNANGVILQKPVFAPSDLVFNLQDPSIAAIIDVASLLQPGGFEIDAYFFNLTWDYSTKLSVTGLTVPSITGITVDQASQQVLWTPSVQGFTKPTGYRVEVIDPNGGYLYNRYTLDHPYNPQLINSVQLSQVDYFANRLIKITPFNALGDGPATSLFHSASGGGPTQGGGGVGGFSECLDVRAYGAVGDGITDDTSAIQQALLQAGANYQQIQAFPPAISNTIVCIPSSMVCLVTPNQFPDNEPATSVPGAFGPAAPALLIPTGVTLNIDGVLRLNVGSTSGAWCVLENKSAYLNGDSLITITGEGVIDCNFPIMGGQKTGAIKLANVQGCQINGVTIQGFNGFGVYAYECQALEITNTLIEPLDQSGYCFLFDSTQSCQLVNNIVYASQIRPGLYGVADYGNKGLIVNANSFLGMTQAGFVHEPTSFETGTLASSPFNSGTTVANNVFASGSAPVTVLISADGAISSGIRLQNNQIFQNTGLGIQIGGLSNFVLSENVVTNNLNGLQKVSGALLQNGSIFNNVVYSNTSSDYPTVYTATSPVYNDGSSTVVMWNPATDGTLYRSYIPQQPTVEGVTPSGKGGYVYPEAPPNGLYSIFKTGGVSSDSPLSQSGTSQNVAVAAFQIEWPDKTVTYGVQTIAITSGYGTYHIFVDDPYRDGTVTSISFGATRNVQDLTTSAGRYYIGSITTAADGSGAGSVGGMVPPGTQIATVTKSFELTCTFDGSPAPGTYTTIYPVVRQITFAGWGASSAWTSTLATASTTFTMFQLIGGVGTPGNVGTFTYSPGNVFATFAGAGCTLNPGDVFLVQSPTPSDSTLGNFGYTLAGLATGTATPVAPQFLTLVLTDSMNFWGNAIRTTGPSQTLGLTDNMNNWQDFVPSTTIQATGIVIGETLQQLQDGTPNVTLGATISINIH